MHDGLHSLTILLKSGNPLLVASAFRERQKGNGMPSGKMPNEIKHFEFITAMRGVREPGRQKEDFHANARACRRRKPSHTPLSHQENPSKPLPLFIIWTTLYGVNRNH